MGPTTAFGAPGIAYDPFSSSIVETPAARSAKTQGLLGESGQARATQTFMLDKEFWKTME